MTTRQERIEAIIREHFASLGGYVEPNIARAAADIIALDAPQPAAAQALFDRVEAVGYRRAENDIVAWLRTLEQHDMVLADIIHVLENRIASPADAIERGEGDRP